MGNLKLIFFVLICSILTNFGYADTIGNEVNIIKNPNFEAKTSGWSRTGAGTFTLETAAPLEGVYSANWDASATGEFFRSTSVTIPVGIQGRTCLIEMLYSWDSGTSGHILMNADDGTNNIATLSIDPTSGGVARKAQLNFTCPTSGTLRFELESTANAAVIKIDRMFIGTGRNTLSSKPQDVVSAKIDGSLSPSVVSSENLDWISGDCTRPITGSFTCTFVPGFFDAIPTCMTSGDSVGGTDTRIANITALSASAISFNLRNGAGTALNNSFSVSCQKSVSSANRETLTLETSGPSWSGYHDNTCSWSVTSVSYADFTADATCSLVERTNSAFGAVVTSGTVLPAITWTPKSVGRYWVCAFPKAQCASNSANCDLRLTDGTTPIVENQFRGEGDASSLHSSPLCGIYSATSTNAVTFKLQGKASTAAVTVASPGTTDVSALEWSIFPISQQLPAPVFTALQNIVRSSEEATKIYGIAVTNSGTPTIASQQGGTWVTSLTDNGVGLTTLNLDATKFTQAPVCQLTMYNDSVSTQSRSIKLGTVSTSTIVVRTLDDIDAVADFDFMVTCFGK